MRGVPAIAVVAAALILGAATALADQTPIGNLGKPDSHRSGAVIWQETGLTVFTAGCPGFARNDELGLDSVTENFTYRLWLLPSAPSGVTGWRIGKTRLDASGTQTGFTFSLRANLEYSEYVVEDPGGELFGSGKITLTRSDGARMSGTGYVYRDWILNSGWAWVTWEGPPTCG